MTKREIVEYVLETPTNTNPAILMEMLEKLEETASGNATEGLVDTSDGTAIASDIIKGKIAYAKKQRIVGTHTDLNTNDATAVADDIKVGKTAYVKGSKITGTHTELDTSDATATAADITKGKTAYVNGKKITGTLEVVVP